MRWGCYSFLEIDFARRPAEKTLDDCGHFLGGECGKSLTTHQSEFSECQCYLQFVVTGWRRHLVVKSAHYLQGLLQIVLRDQASLYQLFHQGTPVERTHARDLSLLKKTVEAEVPTEGK